MLSLCLLNKLSKMNLFSEELPMTMPLNQTIVKKENKQLVLQMVRQQEPISRADIAQATGLNKGTVSTLVAELLSEELLLEIGPGESSGGRKPVLLHFNECAGFSIGIDLGVNYLLAVLTDLKGNILLKFQEDHENTSPEQTIKTIIRMVHQLREKSPTSYYGLIGIGIGVPAIVSTDGTILHAPNLGWKHVQMNQQLMETFDVPVWIDNEANFGVLGEQTYNTSEHQKNILYLSVGIGIGAGLILDGNLFKGMHGHAGEVGHMTMEMNGPTCRCGNLGCWELYASEQALLTHSNPSRTLEELLKLAKNEDQQAVQQFENVARYLGAGIVSLIHTFSPNQIIIGNRLALAHNYLYQELIATVEKRMFAEQLHTEIVFSELITDSTVLGATAFSIEQFIDDHQHHKINRTI